MSDKLHLTLPDGSTFELPPERDVYRLNPILCADFPGHGMRPEDTRCLRCGKEEGLAHRQNYRGCSRDCFHCGTKAHIGTACPKVVESVNTWWWSLRGYEHGGKRNPFLPMDCPKLPDFPIPDLLSSPPPVMLKALDSILSPEENVTIKNRLGAAEQMCTTANRLMHDLGDLVKTVPDELLAPEILEGIAQTAMLSSTLVKGSDHTLLQACIQLQLAMRYALGGRTAGHIQGGKDNSPGSSSGSSLLELVSGLRGEEDDLASSADLIALLADIDSIALRSWETPAYRYDYDGRLVVCEKNGAPVVNTSQPLTGIGVGIQPDVDQSRESIQVYWSAKLRNYQDRPLPPAGTEAVEVDATVISAAEGRRLYVGNLSSNTTDDELKNHFLSAGFSVENVTIPRNHRTSRLQSHGFIETSTPSEALRLIEKWNGQYVLERKVFIQLVRPHVGVLAPDKLTSATDQTIGAKGKGRMEPILEGSVGERKRAHSPTSPGRQVRALMPQFGNVVVDPGTLMPPTPSRLTQSTNSSQPSVLQFGQLPPKSI